MQYSKSFYQIKSSQTIFDYVKDEITKIGYYSLPFQDTSKIKEYAKQVSKKHIAIVGIGGSTLGTFAIYQFLKRTKEFDKKLHFFETTDPTDIKQRVKKLDLEDTLFLIISKSGTTIETISIFKYLASLVTIDAKNCAIISEEDSKLTSFDKKTKYDNF